MQMDIFIEFALVV